MDWHVYLKGDIVFVPTTGALDKGVYREIEPVAVMPLSNTEGVRRASRPGARCPRGTALKSSQDHRHRVLGQAMLFQCYLRRDVVYVPTTAKRGTSIYTAIEPVDVVLAADAAGLARAFHDAIARKNAVIPPIKGKRPPPVLLKYAGAQTWSAFAREASTWNIEENEGTYQIVGHKMHSKGYWVEDADQKITFPPGTKVDAVIERMIATLQDAAR